MSALLLLITILITADIHVLAYIDVCFAEEYDPYFYTATKTPYHYVHGTIPFQTVPDCQAVQIWMLATYGTHYPTLYEIRQTIALVRFKKKIIYNHKKRNIGRMCKRDLNNLKKWNPNLSLHQAKVLTEQGVQDMKLLAKRLQRNFPKLFLPSFNNITSSNYKFRTKNIHASMVSFMDGLFDNNSAIFLNGSYINDTIFTANEACGAWEDDANKQLFKNMERKRFENGLEFQNLLQNVSQRLGFSINIPIETLDAMYNACRYEKAWTIIKFSPWCAVFTKEEFDILEYREDLVYYYKAGYGWKSNTRLGCPLLNDMMQYFQNMTYNETSNNPKGIFYFSNVDSLQNLLTTMGINKDQTHLTAYNYKDMTKRHWRTSFISSFAANLVAVFYKCNDNKQSNKVMFYLSEKPVQLDGCHDGLCDWEFLKIKFDQLSNCTLNACLKRNKAFFILLSLLLAVIPCIILVRLGYRHLQMNVFYSFLLVNRQIRIVE